MQNDMFEVAAHVTDRVLRHIGTPEQGYHLKEVPYEFWPNVEEKAKTYVMHSDSKFYFAKVRVDRNGFWYIRTKRGVTRKIFGWRAKLSNGTVVRCAPCMVNGKVLVDSEHEPLFFFDRVEW